jgi:HK97 family phage prohead protease
MRIEIRNDSALIDGYVNAVARDSRMLINDRGEQFVEQIVPKAFQRALEKSDEVFCLLDHLESRVLGSTKQGNIELCEDNIGLRAICRITDGEVIEKATLDKLRGWSFGFELLKDRYEDAGGSLKRRYVEDLNLLEVSIIDDKAIPAYVGTSIETRADRNFRIEYRSFDDKSQILDLRTKIGASTVVVPDLSEYENYIKILEDKYHEKS